MDTLGLSLIVKDEPVDRVAMLVDYVRSLATQVVIIDTGSKDADIDIPLYRSWGVTAERFDWVDDFAAARNETLKYLTTDWVLHLDADEMPTLPMMEHIGSVLDGDTTKKAKGWLYFTRNFWGGERGIEVEEHWHCRLFRRESGRWYRPLHELVEIEGRPESDTRGRILLKAPKDAYLIHSKPREQMTVSEALYKRMENKHA